MNQQIEYNFDDDTDGKKTSGFKKIGNFIWNSKNKELLGRDGASWGKLSLFYAGFYIWLATFFIGMLAVFMQIMPRDKPTYYGETGTIALKGLNPALGFRPQIDVESHLISFKLDQAEDSKRYHGYQKYVNNLKNFLKEKYDEIDDRDNIPCSPGGNYTGDFVNGKACEFDYNKIFTDTPCTLAKNFGYDKGKPCVLLKLNKVIDFVPKGSLEIKCYADVSSKENPQSSSKDNLKSVTYYTETGTSTETAVIDTRFFPFNAQKGYKAPFVWVQFDLKPDYLVNIECRAIAENIEYERVNKRGLTKISIHLYE